MDIAKSDKNNWLHDYLYKLLITAGVYESDVAEKVKNTSRPAGQKFQV